MPQTPKPVGKAGLTRKQAALDRLKVKPEQLKQVTDITSVLKDFPKGRMLALEAMRFSENPTIKSFLARYDAIPECDRTYLPIEAVCIAAGIEPAYLLGEIILAMRQHSVTRVKMIGIIRHPDVMKRSIKEALSSKGVRDREMVHTMMGALPQKSGATFIDKFFAGKAEEPGEPAAPQTFEDDLDVIFPDVSLMQERVQPMRQKLLETRK